jgi:tetratricopeptide (TPR) repeat protein
LIGEYLRIQDLNLYRVLEIERSATTEEIQAALGRKQEAFAHTNFSAFNLGRDFQKLEQIWAVLHEAEAVLLDPDARSKYDNEALGVSAEPAKPPSLDAEMIFRTGIEYLRESRFAEASEAFQRAIDAMPHEASYHAYLGWSRFLENGRNAAAAEIARENLEHALELNPDDLAAHEYLGIMAIETGSDSGQALKHLERVLDLDPHRTEILGLVQRVRTERGEFQELERQYRRIIFRVGKSYPDLAARLWARIGLVHAQHLSDKDSANLAFDTAQKLAAGNTELESEISELRISVGNQRQEDRKQLRQAWRANPSDLGPIAELLASAKDTPEPDLEYLAASALTALGGADAEVEAFYRRFRPRFLVRAQSVLSARDWRLLCHEDDEPGLGELFALLEPAITQAFPAEEADAEVGDALLIEKARLPQEVRQVRAYVARMLSIAEPAIHARSDYGRQVHVVATNPPVLLAGDEILTSPDKLELGFRMGRAMSFLMPGRLVGASRRARILKAGLLAAYALQAPDLPIDDPDGRTALIGRHLRALPRERLLRIAELAAQISTSRENLNLSRWSRSLSRTANRVGLLLAADLPVVMPFARETTDDPGLQELVDFAVSGRHCAVRKSLGLSVDV